MAELRGTNASLVLKVTRKAPELVPPLGPTPYEFKELSHIDEQPSHLFELPLILFYGNEELTGGAAVRGRDPAQIIKEAVAKALVPYYPLAGRLREKAAGKNLVVECNGEGIMFIEADADATLEDFGDPLHPPFPCFEELLFDVPASSCVFDCPLLLIQVTRLKCGGFTLAVRFNHAMLDGKGLVQFLNAVTELAHGTGTLSVNPVWQRNILTARAPPRVTCSHHEYNDFKHNQVTSNSPHDTKLVHKTFFYGPKEIAKLRLLLPPHLKSSSTFDVITAYLWRCRTVALCLNPNEVTQVRLAVEARSKFNPPLAGYYGNVLAYPLARTTAGKLTSNSLDYALDLIRTAKASVTEEYMRSIADLMVVKGRQPLANFNTFKVSDHIRLGLEKLDFGWGLPLYAGTVKYNSNEQSGLRTFYVPMKNCMGEHGILDYVCLPASSMERFVNELNATFSDDDSKVRVTNFKSLHRFSSSL